jgi:hypothetical protein
VIQCAIENVRFAHSQKNGKVVADEVLKYTTPKLPDHVLLPPPGIISWRTVSNYNLCDF